MGRKLKKGQKPKEKKDYIIDHEPIIPPNPSQWTSEEDDDWDLGFASALFESGDTNRALDNIRQCIDDGTDDPGYWCLYARIQQSLGRDEEADRSIQKALAIDPENPRTLRDTIDFLTTLGRYEEAEQLLERYLAADEGNINAYIRSCWIYVPRSKNEEILAIARRGRANVGDDIRLIILEIRSLLALGRIDEAAEVIRSTPHKEEDKAEWLCLTGEVHNALGNVDLAITTIEEGIAASPDQSFPKASLARVLYQAGRLEEALVALDYAIEIDDCTFEDYLIRAEIRVLHGQFDEAEEDLAVIQDNQHRYPPMLDLMKKISEIRPAKNAGIGYEIYQAKEYQVREDWSGLIQHLDQMEANRYESPLMYTLRGQALGKRGSSDKALEMLRRAIEMEPDSNCGYFYLASLYYDLNKMEEVLTLLEGREEIPGDFGRISLLKGSALISLRRVEEGKKILDIAFARMLNKKNRIEALKEIGFALEFDDQIDDAIMYYEQVLALNPNDPEIIRLLRYLKKPEKKSRAIC